MDAYLGSIFAFAFNYAPQNPGGAWMPCNGQALNISQYEALYALIGTRFGGDGVKTFCLPNLQGRVPIGAGSGTNLTPRVLGQVGGANSVVLTPAQIPAHTHQASVVTLPVGAPGNQTSPVGNYFATAAAGQPYNNAKSQTNNVDDTLGYSSASSSVSGGYTAITTQPPYVAVNYCICVMGVWPPNPNN